MANVVKSGLNLLKRWHKNLPSHLLVISKASRGSGKENLIKRMKQDSSIATSIDIPQSVIEPQSSDDECDLFDTSEEFNLKAELFDEGFEVLTEPHILIETVDEVERNNTILTMEPNFVIMFDFDLSVIRSVELARSLQDNSQIWRFYFLLYKNSNEERNYLLEIRNEKKSFELLIQEKAMLPLKLNRNDANLFDKEISRDCYPRVNFYF